MFLSLIILDSIYTSIAAICIINFVLNREDCHNSLLQIGLTLMVLVWVFNAICYYFLVKSVIINIL
ncbi:hypothetical protein HZS_8063 [Henneguya salminicola]|nr:hypothetical protein HZS_8063 [Henneguya salminicola]